MLSVLKTIPVLNKGLFDKGLVDIEAAFVRGIYMFAVFKTVQIIILNQHTPVH